MFSGTRVKYVAMQHCHIARWHDELKHSGKTRMSFKITSIQDDSTWRTQFNSLLPCWLLIADGLRVSWQRKSEYVTDCAPHSGLEETCSVLVTPWNFWGATMPPLCSRTGLVGPVSKGRWRLSWTNRLCGRNLSSLIRTKLQTPIKWMEKSRFSSSKESKPYTMCCEGVVHCGVWHWWFNTAPRCISKADDKRCLLLQPRLSRVQEKTSHLVVQNTIILHDCARSHTAAAVTVLLRRWKWEILEHPPYSPDMNPCDYDLFAKVKEPLRRDPVQHKRWTYPCYSAVNTEHQQRWTRWWFMMPSRYLAKCAK